MTFVADAGPLLHLFWVGATTWALPPGTIHIVEEVWREVAHHAPEALHDTRFERVAAPEKTPDALAEWQLDQGEQAAIAYALVEKERGPVLVLCDERQGRRACNTLELHVIGSIGLIAEAFRAGRVARAEAEFALRALPGPGRLHVRSELIEQAVASL
jgi:predicted nucleic acid-binding protein